MYSSKKFLLTLNFSSILDHKSKKNYQLKDFNQNPIPIGTNADKVDPIHMMQTRNRFYTIGKSTPTVVPPTLICPPWLLELALIKLIPLRVMLLMLSSNKIFRLCLSLVDQVILVLQLLPQTLLGASLFDRTH